MHSYGRMSVRRVHIFILKRKTKKETKFFVKFMVEQSDRFIKDEPPNIILILKTGGGQFWLSETE